MRPKPEPVVEPEPEVVEESDQDKKKKSKDDDEEPEPEPEPVVIPPDEYDVTQTACFSLSMENGHIVKFLPNGDVMQKKVESKKMNLLYPNTDNPEQELHRVVTGKGTFFSFFFRSRSQPTGDDAANG